MVFTTIQPELTNFGALPPEINSAGMYVGAGSGPMLAATAAWGGLAAELSPAAASYGSVISRLTSEGSQGPASASTAAAAAAYVGWLTTVAEQAEQAAAHAKAAATAYEAAFAMTVPPMVVAANRLKHRGHHRHPGGHAIANSPSWAAHTWASAVGGCVLRCLVLEEERRHSSRQVVARCGFSRTWRDRIARIDLYQELACAILL